MTTSFLVDTTTGEEFVDFASKEPYLVSLKPFAFIKLEETNFRLFTNCYGTEKACNS